MVVLWFPFGAYGFPIVFPITEWQWALCRGAPAAGVGFCFLWYILSTGNLKKAVREENTLEERN